MVLLGLFHRDLLLQQQVDLYSFFPWLGVDTTVMLHPKERLDGTHHRLNRTKVKKVKKKEEEEKSQQKKTLHHSQD